MTVYSASPEWYGNQRSVGKFWVTDPEFGPPNPTDIAVSIQAALNGAKAAGGGEVWIPPAPGGVPWSWKTEVSIDLLAILTKAMSLRCVPGTRIQLNIASPSFNNALSISNVDSNRFTLADFYFRGAGNGTTDAASVIQIGSAVLERCNFYGITASSSFGVVLAGGLCSFYDCGWYACGCSTAPGGCLVLNGTATVESCTFVDVDGLADSASVGASWVTLYGSDINATFINCSFDEDQNASILIDGSGPFSVPFLSKPVVTLIGCAFNTANPSSGTASASIKSDAGGAASIYLENCLFQDSDGVRSAVNLTNGGNLVIDGVTTNVAGQKVSGGDFKLVSQGGNGSWSLRNIMLRPGSSPIFDFSGGAPSSLSISTTGQPIAQPPSLPGLLAWFRPDLGTTAGVVASVTTVSFAFAPVTAGHHLDLLINGYPISIVFSGAENSQASYIATINAAFPGTVFASPSVAQILIQALTIGGLTSGASSGSIVGTTSADVLANLGLSVGPFTSPGVITAVTDQSGLADSTHNLTAPGGVGPTYLRSSPTMGGWDSWTFASGESLVSSVWATPLPSPYTVVIIGRQTTAAIVDAFDGLAANQSSISGNAAENALTLNGGTPAAFTITNPTTIQVWICEFSGAASTISKSSDTIASPQNAGTNTLTGTTIGQIGGGGTSAGWEIGDIIILDHAATLQDRRRINQYAWARYGVTLLP